MKIIIIDTGAANVHSVNKAVIKAGADPCISKNKIDLRNSDAVILPGVGSSNSVMQSLKSLDLIEEIKLYAKSGKPLLCICVGMQVLFDRSDEGDTNCLGIIKGEVKKFPENMKNENNRKMKIPHIGWNKIKIFHKKHKILNNIPDSSYFYFVHSFFCTPKENNNIIATVNYGIEVSAIVGNNNIIGTQFHPEKSGDLGISIYKNFIDMVN
ncbi:MAG: imidazole glycerol phosphate synthase subunit HisH [Dehalococcoidia bacterium]